MLSTQMKGFLKLSSSELQIQVSRVPVPSVFAVCVLKNRVKDFQRRYMNIIFLLPPALATDGA